ncbi:MAG: hypothetical protein IH899_16785 [Planctomycetes bacterium]|nr:hypothetical protein [Planctomycetota bacterium]
MPLAQSVHAAHNGQLPLEPVVDQAIQYWASAGADASQLNLLSGLDVQIADLSGSYLGMSSASSHIIWIDVDAAGYGWGSDGMDLLSTVSHELGHQIGLDHDVMWATLSAGVPQLVASSFLTNLGADDGPGFVGNIGMSSRFGGYFSLSGDRGLSDPWSFTTRRDRIADLTLRSRSDELDQTDLFRVGRNAVAIDLLFSDPDRFPLLDSPYKTADSGGGDGELDLDLGGMAELRIDAATGELNGYLL